MPPAQRASLSGNKVPRKEQNSPVLPVSPVRGVGPGQSWKGKDLMICAFPSSPSLPLSWNLSPKSTSHIRSLPTASPVIPFLFFHEIIELKKKSFKTSTKIANDIIPDLWRKIFKMEYPLKRDTSKFPASCPSTAPHKRRPSVTWQWALLLRPRLHQRAPE